MSWIGGKWSGLSTIGAFSFVCGYCGKDVASNKGYFTDGNPKGNIYICHKCNKPTLVFEGKQFPGELPGKPVENLPKEIDDLYLEAQRCVSAGAFTACILVCRKILMHIGHDKGAKGANFFEYVNFLHEKHYIPPDSEGWVHYIRQKGNEANHEIVIADRDEAIGLLVLTEMLMRIIYELPSRVPKPPAP